MVQAASTTELQPASRCLAVGSLVLLETRYDSGVKGSGLAVLDWTWVRLCGSSGQGFFAGL